MDLLQDNKGFTPVNRTGEKEKNRLTLLFIILMFVVFVKLFFFGLKAAWGISKFVLTIVFLPLILLVMVAGGLISIALPVLLVIGVVGLIASKA